MPSHEECCKMDVISFDFVCNALKDAEKSCSTIQNI